MKRLNITIPEKIDQELSKYPNKSGFIAQAVKEKIKRDRQKQLDLELTNAYKDSKDEDQKLDKDWSNATIEGWE